MSTNSELIEVAGLSKRFCRDFHKSLRYGIADIFTDLSGALPAEALRPNEFWSVDDVSFSLRRGECLGLIGPNGAGKTTLLKLLNGLIKPDRGSIRIRGRVGALIALGAGFSPILTGRENIYVNAAVLGLSRQETQSKLAEILEFADIGDAIDAPVQSYSSGMQVRLGFAVATALEPDVLLIDEVLAVGDAAFRSKCYNKIDRLREKCAVVLVSHSMEHIGRVCDRCLVLERGKPKFLGPVEPAIRAYDSCNEVKYDSFIMVYPPVKKASFHCVSAFGHGKKIIITVNVECQVDVEFVPRVVIFDKVSQVVVEGNHKFNSLSPRLLPAGSSLFSIEVGPLFLRGGEYLVHVNLHDKQGTLMVGGYNCLSIKSEAPTIGEVAQQALMSINS